MLKLCRQSHLQILIVLKDIKNLKRYIKKHGSGTTLGNYFLVLKAFLESDW